MDRRFVVVLMAIFISLSSFSRTFFVDHDATGTNDGSSWENAFTDLSIAVSAAKSGDQIWVAAGIYYPAMQPNYPVGSADPQFNHFTLKNGVTIMGGFAGDETSAEQRDLSANKTILSGDIGHDDVVQAEGYTATTADIRGRNSLKLFYFPEGMDIDTTAVLDGFVLTGAYADNDVFPYMGGAAFLCQGASPKVVNCEFYGNYAKVDGGAIWIQNSSMIIENCTFSGNFAGDQSGAVHFNNTSATLKGCTFTNNSANYGGAVVIIGGEKVSAIENCSFQDNSSRASGGGITVNNARAFISKTTVSNNRAATWGGGIILYDHSDVDIVNCQFFSNKSTTWGGGVASRYNCNIRMTNCKIQGNVAETYAGAGISVSDTVNLSIYNSLVSGNQCPGNSGDEFGAAIFSDKGSIVKAYNITVTGNESKHPSNPSALAVRGSSKIDVYNSIVAYNKNLDQYVADAGTISFYNSMSSGLSGNGNTTANPMLFTNPAAIAIPSTEGNFNLWGNSPVNNKASNSYLPKDVYDLDHDGDKSEPVPYDLDGKPRVFAGIVDMGCYEQQFSSVSGNMLSVNNNQYVDMGTGLTLDNTDFTIEMWIFPNAEMDGTYHNICGSSQSSADKDRSPSLYIFQNDRIHYGYGDGTRWNAGSTEKALKTGQWNHIAMTYNKTTRTLSLFANGRLLEQMAGQGSPRSTALQYINAPMTSGTGVSAYIDEFRVWKKERTSDELLADMNKTLSGNEPNLALYYSFDQVTSGNIEDQAGINNGTMLYSPGIFNSDAILTPVIRGVSNVGIDNFTISWHPVPDAFDYYVDVATDPEFKNLIRQGIPTYKDTAHAINGLSRGTVYYYKVTVKTIKNEWGNQYGHTATKLTPPGNAFEFDGSTYINGSDVCKYDFTESTIETWINTSLQKQMAIWAANSIDGYNNYILYVGSDGHLLVSQSNSGGSYDLNFSNSVFLPAGWNHVAVTIASDKTVNLYVNGELKGSGSGIEAPFPYGSKLSLGQEFDGASTSDFFTGQLDEFRVWNKALTQAEIQANMNKTLTGKENGLVTYYNFDLQTGDKVIDNANIFDGTMVGTPNWVTSTAGLNDFVARPSAQTTSGFTISWDAVPGAADYTIDVATDAEFNSKVISSASSSGNNTYNVSGLTEGTKYYFRVTSDKGDISAVNYTSTQMSPPGNALLLDGKDDYLEANQISGLNFDSKATMECWVKLDPTETRAMILSINSSNGGNRYLLGYDEATGYNLFDAKSNKNINSLDFRKGSWVHLAATMNSAGTSKFYLNGKFIGSLPGGYDPFINGDLVSFGQEFDGSRTTDFVKGAIDEIRIWNIERTENEIRSDMNKKLTGSEPGLEAYYDFDQSEGLFVYEKVKGLDATIIGNPQWIRSDALITPLVASIDEVTPSSITFSWNAVDGAADYKLEVATDAKFTSVLKAIASTSGATSYKIDGLTEGTGYFLRLASVTNRQSAWNTTEKVSTLLVPPGNALAFNGADDMVNLGQFMNSNWSQITLEAWVKPDPKQPEGLWPRIIGGFSNAEKSGFALGLQPATGVYFESYDQNDSHQYFNTSADIRDGKWHHVAATYDGANYRIYVDNRLEKEVNLPGLEIKKATMDIGIGNAWDGVAYHYFNGSIDEARIWNVARTETELKEFAHKSLTGTEPGLVSYYNLDKAEGNTFLDAAGNNNGTMQGSVEWAESKALITPFTLAASNVNDNGFTANWEAIPGASKYYLRIAADPLLTQLAEGYDSLNVGNVNSFDITGLTEHTTYYYGVMSITDRPSAWSPVSAPVATTGGNAGELAANLDGSGNYIDLSAQIAKIAGKNTGAFTGWFKGTQKGSIFLMNGDANNSMNIYVGDLVSDMNDESFWFVLKRDGVLQLSMGVNEGHNAFLDNVWHHFAIITGDGDNRILIDGIPRKLKFYHDAGNKTIQEFSSITNPVSLTVGNGTSVKVDEIAIYKNPITNNEAIERAHRKLSGDEIGLVAYYNFDHSNVVDASGMGRDGNIAGTISFEQANVLPVPFLNKPVPGVTVADISWEKLAGAQQYVLDVATDADFVNKVMNNKILNDASYHLTNLDKNTTYYYRIKAKDDSLWSEWSATGKFTQLPGKALTLDGVDDYGVITNPITDDFTLELWIKPDSMAHKDVVYQFYRGYGLVSGEVSGISNDFGLAYLNGRIVFGVGEAGVSDQSVYTADSCINTNIWNHVAVTRQKSTGTIKLYVNGKLKASQTNTSKNSLTDPTKLYIGSLYATPAAGQMFKGQIDELRVWNKVLTENEIRANMNLSDPEGSTDSYIAHYTFDEVARYTVKDQAMQIDMDLVNGATIANSEGVIVPITLEANNPAPGSFDMHINNIVSAQSFEIEVAYDASFVPPLAVHKNIARTLDYTVDGLCPGVKYYYRTRAIYDGKTISDWSIPDTISTVNQDAVIRNFKATQGDYSQKLKLSWECSNEYLISNFEIKRRIAGEQEFLPLAMVENNHNLYQFTDSTAEPGTYYEYTVQGLSYCYNNDTQLDTSNVGYNIPTLEQSKEINAQTQQAYIRLDWKYSNNFCRNVEILRTNTETGITETFQEVADSLVYRDGTVNLCVPYTYQLVAKTANYGDVKSHTGQFTLQENILDAIDTFDVSKGYFDNKIALNWVSHKQNIIDEYQISRRKYITGADWQVVKIVDKGTSQAWIDEDAMAGEYYEYMIVGIGTCGSNSLFTDSVLSVGFRQPEGSISGQVTFAGGNPVKDVKLTVSSDDAGAPASCLEFGGSDTLIIHPVKTFDFSNGITVEMWVNPSTGNNNYELFRNNGLQLSCSSAGLLTAASGSTSVNYNINTDSKNVWNDGWNHLAVTISGDTLQLLINGSMVINSTAMVHLVPSFGTTSLGSGYSGLLEELRIWNEVRSDSIVNYFKGLMLSRDTKGLVCNLRFDEGRGIYTFDHSRTDGDANKSHAIIYGAEWSNAIPSQATLSLGAKSVAAGNYNAQGIWFKGSGITYKITPSFGVHKFDPSNRSMLISENSLIYSSQNFTDISSFPVSGNVKYYGADFPVKDVMIAVDGQICVNAEGQPIVTDDNGDFSIEVPIGEHFISVQKMSHIFSSGYFPPKDADGNVTYHLFDNPVSGIQFIDSTFLTVAGRIAGGTVEGDKEIGFGKSKNNLGVCQFTLKAVKGYPIDGVNNTITVSTDPQSGEYEVKLYPEQYRFVTDATHFIGNGTYEFNSADDLANINLSDPLLDNTATDTATIMIVNGTDTIYQDTVYQYTYQLKRNWIYRSIPSIEVLSKNGNPYFYDSLVYVQNAAKDTVPFLLINGDGSNRLSYPVFTKGNFYSTVIHVFEEYTNADNGTTDRVPVQDGKITVINGCATYPAPVDYPIENGKVLYNFVGGFPNPTLDNSNPELSFTKTFEVHSYTGVNGSMQSQWPKNGPFRAYVFGGIPTGQNFVTQGPDQVDFVLRDPPGSNSSASFEKGFTVTNSVSNSFDNSASVNNSLNVDLGWEVTTFVGFGAGIINTNEQVANIETGVGFESNYSGGHSSEQTTTFTQNYSTSDDPAYVGVMGDLFFGHSTNINYGVSNCINIIPAGTGEQEIDAQVDGFTVGLKKGLNLGLKYGTSFIYTQNHIENYLIPGLEEMRDKLLSEGNVDSAEFYTQQADLWRKTLATNEYDKYLAMKNKNVFPENKNISFDAGSVYSESMQSETTESHSSSFEFSINASVSSELGFEVFGMGSTWKMESSVSRSQNTESENSNTESSTVSYTLNDGDQGDYFSVDILKSPYGWGPVFSTLGGQSACPYEGGAMVQYADYLDRNHPSDFSNDFRLSNPTMRIEVPKISAVNAIISGVPEDQPAVFTLKLSNQSEVNADNWFTLELDAASNPDGAKLLMDGAAIVNGVSIMIPGGTTLTKTLELVKGQAAVNDYENIRLILHSQCQFDPTDDIEDISDTVAITANFVPACTGVSLRNPMDNWIVNAAMQDTLPVRISDYNVNHSTFEKIAFQYREESASSWNTVAMFFNDTTNFGTYNGEKYKIGGIISLAYKWDMTALQDKTWQIRALAMCSDGSVTEGAPLTGILDGVRPQVFGTPGPADGILDPNDDIMVTFNEPVEAGAVTSYNIDIEGVLNGSEINHGTSISLDGTSDFVRTPEGINLKGGSYTVEFWLKKDAGATGTIFSQGSSTEDQLEILFSNDSIKLVSGTNHLAGINSPDDGNWHHYAVVYNNDNQTAQIYIDDRITSEGTFEQGVASGIITIGKSGITGSSYLKANIHDFRIWHAARDYSSIVSGMNTNPDGDEPGLTSIWPMNEGNGSLLTDKSHSRNAALSGAWLVEPASSAIRLNGSGQAIMFETGSIPVTADMDFTTEFWFRSAGQTGTATLFSNGSMSASGYSPEKTLNINMISNGLIEVRSKDKVITTSRGYDDNQWHHLAFVVNRRGYATLYMDGEKLNSVTAPGFGSFESPSAYIGALGYLDNNSNHQTGNYFNGMMDEVRIWNLARSQRQIGLYMNNRLSGKEIGLLAYFPFEEYINQMGVLISANTLDDNSVDPNSSPETNHCGTAVMIGTPEFTGLSPVIKQPLAKSKVNIDFVVNNDKIVITPAENLARIEKCVLEITVRNIQDKHGNTMASPVTWTAYVKKNQVVWGDDNFSLVKEVDSTLMFKTSVANTGGTAQNFTISNIPVWLTASVVTGSISPVSKTDVTFTVADGLNIGNYSEDIYLAGDNGYQEKLPVNLRVFRKEPSWNVDKTAFQSSMNIIGQLRIRNVLSNDQYDMIGVFAGDVCRGVAHLQYNANYDAYFVFLTVYGNQQGEILTYRIWDASEGVIYSDTDPVYNFVPNQIYGKMAQPVVFSGGNKLDHSVVLNAGWNWLSFNLNLDSASVSSVFGNLTHTGGDVVKHSGIFTTYDEVLNRWVGSLSNVEIGKLYQARIQKGGVLRYMGTQPDVSGHPITLEYGWNRIGYVPSVNLTVNEALSGFIPQVNDVIKSQYQFAMYDGYEWVGSMTYMEPGKGYMYQSNSTDNISFVYPSTSEWGSSKFKSSNWTNTGGMFSAASDYEYVMSVVTVVDGSQIPAEGRLGAYIHGELRGMVELRGQSPCKNYGFITVYGNPGDMEETIEFRIISHDGELPLNGSCEFAGTEIYGTLDNPLVLTVNSLSGSFPFMKNEISAYPNPFSENLEVNIILKKKEKVSIDVYNMVGEKVAELYNDELESGLHQFIWFGMDKGRRVQSGMYVVKMITPGEIKMIKVVKQ